MLPRQSTYGLDTGSVNGDWRERAACRDADPELFFHEGDSIFALGYQARAKQICAGCPVADRCLAEALRLGEPFGVWGGMTPGERRWATDRREVHPPKALTRWCQRCREPFDVDPLQPYARICAGCCAPSTSRIRRKKVSWA